jgi:hypothetical protein
MARKHVYLENLRERVMKKVGQRATSRNRRTRNELSAA